MALTTKTTFGRRRIFRRYYRVNYWRNDESVSGPGSSMARTATVRAELPALCERLGIRTLLDVPCGDATWIRQVDRCVDRYIGADIVPELIDDLRRTAADFEEFHCLDAISDDLPAADAVLARDFFIHLPQRHVLTAVENMRRTGARYLLTTHFGEHDNADIVTGLWRPVNLTAPPYSFGEPLATIDEAVPDERFRDKTLAVFDFDAIPIR